jgi:hypothetical protein
MIRVEWSTPDPPEEAWRMAEMDDGGVRGTIPAPPRETFREWLANFWAFLLPSCAK